MGWYFLTVVDVGEVGYVENSRIIRVCVCGGWKRGDWLERGWID